MDQENPNIIPDSQETNLDKSNVDDSLLNTTLPEDLVLNESQDFSLLDFASSQASQSSQDDVKPTEAFKPSNTNNQVTNSQKTVLKPQNSITANEDASTKSPESQIPIVDENSMKTGDKSPEFPEINDDDEVIASTPPEELFSPSKHQLFGATTSLKRKADGPEELSAKILRLSTEKKISDPPDQSESKILKETIDQSLQVLSQALEEAINDHEPEQPTESNLISMKEVSEPTEDSKQISSINRQPPSPEKSSNESHTLTKSTEDYLKGHESAGKNNSNLPDDIPVKKSRQSIEVIFEKSLSVPTKPQELVEIDEDGEKIILDSSRDDSGLTTSQSLPDNSELLKENTGNLTNGSNNSKISSDDKTELCKSTTNSSDSKTPVPTPPSLKKQPDVLNLVSDSEGESSISEDKPKVKTIPVERELNVLIKLKCMMHIDETTKEIISNDMTIVQCECLPEEPMLRRRNTSDTSVLGDISDNSKDPVSPGSVTSNPAQTYPLPSRLSMVSQASSSSSSSSASSKKDEPLFSQPRGVPKHAKKLQESQKEFKNAHLLTTSVLKFLYDDLHSPSEQHNGTEHADSTLERFSGPSSTPETIKLPIATSKPVKRARVTKRTRSQNSRSSKSNGLGKMSPQTSTTLTEVREIEHEQNTTLSSSSTSTPSKQGPRSLSSLRSQTPSQELNDPSIDKPCFAKWTDDNYYPGVIIGKSRNKIKVNFLDGKTKLLVENFVVPCPEILHCGTSVYAATSGDNFGSCGIILSYEEKPDEKVMYLIETDEEERIKVPIDEIFLTEDQANILREMGKDISSPPSTPQMGKITLENLVEGTRRNKGSPVVSTPKSARTRGTPAKKKLEEKPSSSGIPSKLAFDPSESDSNVSVQEDCGLGGIHPEFIGHSGEFVSKGPPSRLKGKGKSKKKADDPETIASVGPIPKPGSTLFQGMNFILTCAQLQSLDKYKAEFKAESTSEVGTEYEDEWTAKPFIRERLVEQITAGGGKVYDNFEDLPKEEWEKTKLITNVPNATARSLLCLSVGIRAYNHQWIIKSCQDMKVLPPGAEMLPAGWSLDKRSYVEYDHRKSNKPLNHVVVVIPKIPGAEQSTTFWQKVIEYAGGKVQFVEDSLTDKFDTATIVLTNKNCPSWVEKEANNWTIPMVSTTWIVQCLVEGKTVPFDTQAAYLHNYIIN